MEKKKKKSCVTTFKAILSKRMLGKKIKQNNTNHTDWMSQCVGGN